MTRVGTGPRSVVFLHGFLGSGRNLATLARAWSQADSTRSFALMDLTGHGNSPALPPDASLATMARDVLETAAAEHVVEPLTIVGHSLGGRVALQALLLAPERIGRLELLDIGPGPIGDAGDEQSGLMRIFAEAPEHYPSRASARELFQAQGVSTALTEWILTNLVADDQGYRWRINRAALEALRPRMNATDLWPALERDGARVRCLRGARSTYVSDEDAARMKRLHCQVVTLPESGHYVHVDQPAELLKLLVVGNP